MSRIQVLFDEHENIRRMLRVVRTASLKVMQGEALQVEDFRKMIVFIRTYADATHHGKEEDYLFKEMLNHMGALAVNLVERGMLVEHNLGRSYIYDLSEALDRYEQSPTDEAKLDILVAAGAYVTLLTRHIDKENTGVFVFAENQLPEAALNKVVEEMAHYENEAIHIETKREQIAVLEVLESKYI